MKKVALLALVVVLAFVFIGCASSFERHSGLKEEGLGRISDVQIEKRESGEPAYCVKIWYCAKESTVLVSRKTYEKLWIGESVYLKFFTETHQDEDENGHDSCEVTYTWWATDGSLDRALLGKFKLPR